MAERGLRKTRVGKVVSNKMVKTIVVAVEDKRWRLVEIVEKAK